MHYFVYLIICANLIALIQMAADKRKAEKQRRRIPEIQLIAPTLLGGFPGILLGMTLFRHKTRKRSFQLKLLLTLAAFAGIVYFIIS
ncbi:DUF1294 domain-containing protein [Verrucomicrobia bacterium S94]|nr:DUF1294 domain-containing protein [Verrucomicrobia bacterium S94]